MKTKPHIRWMVRRDMAEVLAIEMDVFEFPWKSGAGKEPTPPNSFVHALRQRNNIGMVVEDGSKVGGYMIYSLHAHRIEVMNFAVRRDLWRHGYGRAMIEKLIANLSSQRRSRLIFDVWETNLPMQVFLRSMGFRAVSVIERAFVPDTCEDAYRFVFRYQPQTESRRPAAMEAAQ